MTCHRTRIFFARRRPSFRDEAGVALVEFALVLPILLLLVLGMMDFGKAFNYWIDETHLANVGARWAVVNKNPGPEATLQDSIQQQADTEELRAGGTESIPTRVQVCLTFEDVDGDGLTEVGDAVKGAVSVEYHWLPFLTQYLGDAAEDITTTTVTASATMRLEAVPTNYTAGCST